MKRYQIAVTLRQGMKRSSEVRAENANEAVITGLLQMGIVSLMSVTGITIGTPD
jgi:hypothetical protein